MRTPMWSATRCARRARQSIASAALEPATKGALSLARRRPGAPGRPGVPPIMAERVKVGVLLSGRGSNFEAISEYKRKDPDRAYDIALVASNVPEARGLVLARRFGIPI